MFSCDIARRVSRLDCLRGTARGRDGLDAAPPERYDEVVKALAGVAPKKLIVVPGRIVNVVL